RATSVLSPLSLHDALPILISASRASSPRSRCSKFFPEMRTMRRNDHVRDLVSASTSLMLAWFVAFSAAAAAGEPDLVFSVKTWRSEEHTSELQSLTNLVCR